jgi:predicted Zn-dependent peptidase
VTRAVAVVVAAALTGGAGTAAAGPLEIERVEIPGGARVLLAPRAARRATLVVQFAQGSVDDDNRSGLTRLVQHVLLEANARLDWPGTIATLHAGGGTLTIQTDLRSSAFVLEADRREFDAVAPSLIAALLGPRVDRVRFPGAIRRALHDAKAPGRGSGLLELVAQTASSDPRYHNEPWGDPDQIELVEPQAVEELLRGPFSPANARIVAAGSFDKARLVAAVRRSTGGKPVERPPAPFALPVTSHERAAREMHILAWPFDVEWPQDAAATRVLAILVQRVLWQRFREAGLAYSFQVAADRSPGLNLFVVALPIRRDAGPAAGAALAAALEDVRIGKFDDALLERARAIALGQLAADDESPDTLAAALAAGGELWHGRAVRDALQALDRRAFGAVAGRLLARERSIALHFGPDVEGRRR